MLIRIGMRCSGVHIIVNNKFMPSGLKNYYFPITLRYCPTTTKQATWVGELAVKNWRNYRNDQGDHIDKTEQSHVIED